MTPAELFPDEDYKLQMRFWRGDPAAYFAPTTDHAALVAERAHWLGTRPAVYAALLPEGGGMLAESVNLAKQWNAFAPDAGERLLALGRFWEPDFLLLKADAAGAIRLFGGCVCFPSHWRLTDKVGQPIEFIHSPVPGLNENLGDAIHKFLAGLKPGVAWQRVNWGLSRSAELNQHPDRRLARLEAETRLDEIWLRVEEQALVALPESHGILFGIRIVNHRLAEVVSADGVRSRFARAIKTIPEALARYKNLFEVRPQLLRLLGD